MSWRTSAADTSDASAPLHISDRRVQTICLMVLSGVAATYLVYWLRPVLVPFVVACFVVSGVGPILNVLQSRLHVSRLVAAALAFILGMAILAAFGIAIWLSFFDLNANADAYRGRVRQLVSRLDKALPLNLSLPQPASKSPESDDAATGQPAPPPETVKFVDQVVRNGISMVSQAFMSLVSTSMVVLIYVFFLLLGNPSGSHSNATVREMDQQIRSYLSLKTVISVSTRAAFGLTLWLFGVPMAVSFGVLAFLLTDVLISSTLQPGLTPAVDWSLIDPCFNRS